VEYNDDGFLKYFIKHKMHKYLKERPRSADSPNSKATNKYGVHMKSFQKKLLTELVDEYVKKHHEDIFFLKLLNELSVYGKKNTDRVMAFGMALIHSMDAERRVYDSAEEDKEDKMFIPHFGRSKDGGIVSIHRDSDGNLHKSGRKANFDYDFSND
jgi:hypothetical protein